MSIRLLIHVIVDTPLWLVLAVVLLAVESQRFQKRKTILRKRKGAPKLIKRSSLSDADVEVVEVVEVVEDAVAVVDVVGAGHVVVVVAAGIKACLLTEDELKG